MMSHHFARSLLLVLLIYFFSHLACIDIPTY